MGLSLVADDEDLAPRLREDLSHAEANLVRCAKLVSELLDGTRIERGTIAIEPQAIDAERLIHDLVTDVDRGPDAIPARLAIRIATDLPRAYADPERFRQVLTNLIDNALKFTAPGSTVTISARRSLRRPEMLEFAVADQGEGIDPRTCDKLFQPFHQEQTPQSREGLGLGLYICRELVERHGGEIWAENAETRGARFTFTVPRHALPATRAL
jgi:signal transduction histidine kinase